LVALGHILNRYLRSRTSRADSHWAVACRFFVELLVRGCLGIGIGDPDNGGVLVIDGLKFGCSLIRGHRASPA